MSGAGRFEINILNPSFGQLIAEVLGVWAFHGSDSQEENLDLFVERICISKHAVIGSFRIEFAPKPARAAAESSDISEFVQVGQSCHEGLHASLPVSHEDRYPTGWVAGVLADVVRRHFKPMQGVQDFIAPSIRVDATHDGSITYAKQGGQLTEEQREALLLGLVPSLT